VKIDARTRHTTLTALLMSLVFLGVPREGATQSRASVPKVTGPLPVSATSRPFLDSSHVFVPMDLAKVGYVEQEFLVSGTANVYDWMTDGSTTVKSPASPYTTRILVRRPANAARFSGAVLVELMYPPRRWDWPMMWGYMHDGLIARGDAWVGITVPGSIAGLQKFDPMRYAALSFANPSSMPCAGQAAAAPIEDGLKWDAITQIGVLLKSRSAGAPFAGFPPSSLYMTVQGGDLTTYMNAFHRAARLENGRPVYDGYLARAPFNATRISQCAPTPAAGDPRTIVRNVDVPVIAVAPQGDVPNALALRRDDSDQPGDRYRLYEVAGSGHIDKFAYTGFPSMEDQTAAGNAQGSVEWPFAMPCTPPIPLMDVPILTTVYDAAFANLDEWARKGKPAPRASRLNATGEGRQVTIASDEFGHGTAGVRTPYVDVPIASYTTSSPGPGTCAEMGHVMPFDAAKLKTMYGSFDAYLSKLNASIARLSMERWLTPEDAKRLRKELGDSQRSRWSSLSTARADH
jgi:hypothetical protein